MTLDNAKAVLLKAATEAEECAQHYRTNTRHEAIPLARQHAEACEQLGAAIRLVMLELERK
jgi:hypothetical protein